MPPAEETKYPLLQSVLLCFPQYGKLYFSNNKDVDFAFKHPIIEERQSFGFVDRIRWIWSDSPLISSTLTLIDLAMIGISLYMSESIFWFKHCLRNFVIKIT